MAAYNGEVTDISSYFREQYGAETLAFTQGFFIPLKDANISSQNYFRKEKVDILRLPFIAGPDDLRLSGF